MVYPAVILCFALATLTFGAPNVYSTEDPQAQGVVSAGSQEHGSRPRIRIVYEFGTPTRYDVQITPNAPFVDRPSLFPLNINANVKYTDTQRRNVTYLRIEAEQDSDEGSARIVGGAIGTEFISIDIEAFRVMSFKYNAEFYTSPLIQNTLQIGNMKQQLVELTRVQGAEQYSKNSNLKAFLKSPGKENITAVLITTKQTSNLVNAYISKGRLGEKQMEITLEAQNTMMLSYEAVFYTSGASKPCLENNNNQTDHHNSVEFIYFKAS